MQLGVARSLERWAASGRGGGKAPTRTRSR